MLRIWCSKRKEFIAATQMKRALILLHQAQEIQWHEAQIALTEDDRNI